jgi:DNA-binding beta-propeller fold protein YncE
MRSPLGPTVLATVVAAAPAIAAADILVASFNNDQIQRYNEQTGQFVGVFVGPDPLNGPMDLTYAPDGTLWVTSLVAPNFEAASVIQYDGQNGALRRVVVRVTEGGLIGPTGLAFAEDGRVLVCNKFGGGDIRRFDALTGALVPPAPFIPHSTLPPAGVNAPEDIVRGPDGLLYISENHDGSIRRFDAQGSPVGAFGQPFGNSASPQGMAFGPDGHLYVALYGYDQVWQLNRQTGEPMATISVLRPTLGLLLGGPMGLAWGPDGNLYVANYLDHQVAVINGQTLTLERVLTQSPMLQNPTHLVFMPAPVCYANCDGSAAPPALNVGDFTCFLQRFAAGESYANCDNSTVPPVLNVGDFTCFLQSFAAGCP